MDYWKPQNTKILEDIREEEEKIGKLKGEGKYQWPPPMVSQKEAMQQYPSPMEMFTPFEQMGESMAATLWSPFYKTETGVSAVKQWTPQSVLPEGKLVEAYEKWEEPAATLPWTSPITEEKARVGLKGWVEFVPELAIWNAMGAAGLDQALGLLAKLPIKQLQRLTKGKPQLGKVLDKVSKGEQLSQEELNLARKEIEKVPGFKPEAKPIKFLTEEPLGGLPEDLAKKFAKGEKLTPAEEKLVKETGGELLAEEELFTLPLGEMPKKQVTKVINRAVDRLTKHLGYTKKIRKPITKEELRPTFEKKLNEGIDNIFYRTIRQERLLEKADGYAEGPMYRTFWKSINGATDKKLSAEIRKQGEFRQFAKDNKINIGRLLKNREEVAPKVYLTSGEKIGVYLHTLNPQNMLHLKYGNQFTDEIIQQVISKLTPEEKLIADYFIKFWQAEGPELSKVVKGLTGKELELVENYFPLRLEWRAHPVTSVEKQLRWEAKRRFIEKWPTSKISKGFIKKRTKKALQPVKLDAFELFLEHTQRVEHYKAFEPVMKVLQRIAKNPKFATAYSEKTSESEYRVLLKWLEQSAEVDPLAAKTTSEQILRTLRGNAVMAVLGTNIVTCLKQFPSFFIGMAEAGEAAVLKGLFTFIRHPKETRELIKQYAPQIYKRSFEREIAEAKTMRSLEKGLMDNKSWREMFMILTTSMDKFVVSSIWRGAYDNFLVKGRGDVREAAEYATKIIRTTQPFFSVKDVPEFWRSGEFMKALTMFTNQLNQYWNYFLFDIVGKSAAGKISKIEAIRKYVEGLVIPALMIGWIAKSKPQENVRELAEDFIGAQMASVPVVGSWIASGIRGYQGQGIITTELLGRMHEFAYNANKENWEKAILVLPELAGYGLGIPVSQPKRFFESLIDIAEGKSDDWLSLIWGKYVRDEEPSPPKMKWEPYEPSKTGRTKQNYEDLKWPPS